MLQSKKIPFFYQLIVASAWSPCADEDTSNSTNSYSPTMKGETTFAYENMLKR